MEYNVANQDKIIRIYAQYAEVLPCASGWQKFSYGYLGEVTKNIRTFALPFEEHPFTFVMEYEYDSWNRIQRMTYPDGEEVSYEYNKGGMLQRVTGVKNGIPYKYVNNILYNKFEQKESVEYGNGTSVTYDYDLLQRLAHLVSLTLQHDTMQNITYVYDAVGNIKSINNVAVILANGLGGTYNSYSYDKLYRLSEAAGNWQGGDMLNYNLKMEYHKNGRVKCKNLAANTIIPYGHEDVSYQRGYFYENSSQPNTLTRIHEQEWISPTGLGEGIFTISDNPITPSNPSVSCQYDFEWDATGNLTRHYNEIESANYDRRLCWDEENRLQGVVDATHQTLYQYDANGERTYKLTSSNLTQLINGHWSTYTIMDNATLYASPYLVATPKGYTKHYYAESERIASKIGMGGLKDICKSLCPDMTLQYRDPESECEEPRECFYEKLGQNQEHSELVMGECLGTSLEVEPNLLTEGLYSMREVIEENEQDCYWYHPDHLGSSSWITYTDGSAVQHLHYLPWGEDFVDQRSTNWNAMYTFSAKEKDTETGYSYFGARYYSSDLSIWLSVDPMSDKYPSSSPYTYCANNPVRLVDPNGEKWEDEDSENLANTLIKQAENRQANFSPDSKEYKLLQEGIDGLKAMGNDESQIYAFKPSGTDKGSVSLQENGTININYVERSDFEDSKNASAWHEAFHLMRRNKYRAYSVDELKNASTTYWGFKNGKLGNNNNFDEEYLTYTSQLIFSPNSMPTNDGVKVVNDASIRNYIIKHYGCPSDHEFQFPTP